MSWLEFLGDAAGQAAHAVYNRRAMVRGLAARGLGATAAAAIVFNARPRVAGAQTVPSVVTILNFALTLEYLEQSYYSAGLSTAGLIPAADRPIFEQILADEDGHVAFIEGAIRALGSTPRARPVPDFTGGNGSNAGPFRPLADYAQFLVLSEAFTSTGVRAYKGQGPNLLANNARATLRDALTIHSVEARHSSMVKRLRGDFQEQAPQKGWVTQRQVSGPSPAAVAALTQVFGPGTNPAVALPEENPAQAGIVLTSLPAGTSGATINADTATESFDEPLDMAAVIAIADPFIAGPGVG